VSDVAAPCRMAITRLPHCTLLKVFGAVPRAAVDDFRRAAVDVTSYSPVPVVVDLRDVEKMHPKAKATLRELLATVRRVGGVVDVLIRVPSMELNNLILQAESGGFAGPAKKVVRRALGRRTGLRMLQCCPILERRVLEQGVE
jgi:hypothetical protein